MGKKIVIMGTADTKGEQLQFLKETIESTGQQGILMDISMGGEPAVKPDIQSEEIAGLAGKDLKDLVASSDRFAVTETMTLGAEQKALELLSRGNLDGMVALGGATIALAGSRVMSRLPFGIPKVIVLRVTIIKIQRVSCW